MKQQSPTSSSKKPEHSVVGVKLVDGQVFHAVIVDGEEKLINFTMVGGLRAQFVGESDWFCNLAEHTSYEWWKMNASGSPIARYKKDQNRISRLLDRLARRALSDLILGE